MAGGFVNTSFKNTTDSLIQGYKNRLRNPYYKWNSQNVTKVDYYNLSNTKTTFDEGTQNIYDDYNRNSSLRYNLIRDCYLYGLDRIQLSLDNGDFGLEGGEITGSAVTLPNTFEPYPQDYFVIDHIDTRYVFKITSVTPDTLENGQNFYQLEYKLDHTDEKALSHMVASEYNMMIDNVGTSFKSIIRSDDYDVINKIDTTLLMLKQYYKSLFYTERVESFILHHMGSNFYDSYLTEFIMKNDLMNKSGDYLCVEQKIDLPASFPLEYDKTIFRAIELRDKSKLTAITSKASIIDNPFYIMAYRPERYYSIEYFSDLFLAKAINNISPELINKIHKNEKYINDEDMYKNIIIDYFNGVNDFDVKYLDLIDNVSYTADIEFYYVMIILIYILQYHLKRFLNKNI